VSFDLETPFLFVVHLVEGEWSGRMGREKKGMKQGGESAQRDY